MNPRIPALVAAAFLVGSPAHGSDTIEVGRIAFEKPWYNVPGANHPGTNILLNSCSSCHSVGGEGGLGARSKDNLWFVPQKVARLSKSKQEPVLIHEFIAIVENPGAEAENFSFNTIPGLGFVSKRTAPAVWNGGVDSVSDEVILQVAEEQRSKGIRGRPALLESGGLGRFGSQLQVSTLEEFILLAFDHELGLDPSEVHALDAGGPRCEPGKERQAHCTPCEDSISCIANYLRSLSPPERESHVPENWYEPQAFLDNESFHDRAMRGEQLFGEIGCSDCHRLDMPGFTDFQLHDLGLRRLSFVNLGVARAGEWATSHLQGVGAKIRLGFPMMHDGSAADAASAISLHGGDASFARQAFEQLPYRDAQSVLFFLREL
jgi:CxxC motif-containing protein (DUF1111 family)